MTLKIQFKGVHVSNRSDRIGYFQFGLSALLLLMVLVITSCSKYSELHIGTSTADITPELPVALTGQFHLRIADTVETPLTANVVVLESRDGKHSLDAAIMVSCDLLYTSNEMLEMVRKNVKEEIPELDVSKIFLSATHTHTAPVLEYDPDSDFSFQYQVPEEGVVQVKDYIAFFVQQVSEAIVKAWGKRSQGSVTWGLGHAVASHNRRVVYSKEAAIPGPFTNKKAQMYGNTNSPEFMNLEGMEDHDVNILFFWNNQDKLIATAINLACPAQEVEGRSTINADYWHFVREKLKQRFGPELTVLGWGSAAGDQSPRPMYRKAAEERMIKLRNLSRLEEIARRIVLAVEETYDAVKDDRHTDVQLIHKVETISLPMRIVTHEEYEFSKAERDKYAAQMAADPKAADKVLASMTWNADVVRRFEQQKKNSIPTHETEIHVLRLGDIALSTNQFELFTDYGIRIQARSNALQTFVISFTGPISYLPTEKAVKGGGYSAVIQSGMVGSEGGQVLVDRTVNLINEMFPKVN